MLELPGQSALSNFRLEKLTRALQRADQRLKTVDANFIYLIDTNSALGKQQRARLNALLLSGEAPGKFTRSSNRLYVVPRPGTISPWSTVRDAPASAGNWPMTATTSSSATTGAGWSAVALINPATLRAAGRNRCSSALNEGRSSETV